VDIDNGNVLPLDSESICVDEADNTELQMGQRQVALSVYSRRNGVAGICAWFDLMLERNAKYLSDVVRNPRSKSE